MLRALAVYIQEPVTHIRTVNGKKEEYTVLEYKLVQIAGQDNLKDEILSAIKGEYKTNTAGFIYIKEDVLIDAKTQTQKRCWLAIVSKTPHLTQELKLQLAYLFINMRHVLNREATVKATLKDMYLNTPNFISKDILITKTQEDIAQTRVMMITNIEAILKRGEAIENLQQRTQALETQSMLFNKQARELNACCYGYIPKPWG